MFIAAQARTYINLTVAMPAAQTTLSGTGTIQLLPVMTLTSAILVWMLERTDLAKTIDRRPMHGTSTSWAKLTNTKLLGFARGRVSKFRLWQPRPGPLEDHYD